MPDGTSIGIVVMTGSFTAGGSANCLDVPSPFVAMPGAAVDAPGATAPEVAVSAAGELPAGAACWSIGEPHAAVMTTSASASSLNSPRMIAPFMSDGRNAPVENYVTSLLTPDT